MRYCVSYAVVFLRFATSSPSAALCSLRYQSLTVLAFVTQLTTVL
jgi:hypothetical protein